MEVIGVTSSIEVAPQPAHVPAKSDPEQSQQPEESTIKYGSSFVSDLKPGIYQNIRSTYRRDVSALNPGGTSEGRREWSISLCTVCCRHFTCRQHGDCSRGPPMCEKGGAIYCAAIVITSEQARRQ